MSTTAVNLMDRTIAEKRVGNETPLKPQNDETGRVVATPHHTSAQARAAAKGKVKSSGMKAIEAEATTIGLPYLKARESITIENIGKKFSGNWRITKIRHEISSSGYLCNLTLNKNNHSSNSGGKAAKPNEPPKKPVNANNNGNPKPAGDKNSSNKPPTTKVDLRAGQIVK